MRRRTVVSGITLVVLLGVLGAMAVYGFLAATAPLPTAEQPTGDECSAEETVVQTTVARGSVTVSVFNAGGSSGLAGRSMDRLEDAGFVAGDIGNAPASDGPRAVVRTTEEDDTAARLVARALGEGVRVRVVADDLGPGIDVIVRDDVQIDPEAPQELELAEPIEQCVPVQ